MGKIWPKGFLLLFGILFGLLVCEVVVRYFEPWLLREAADARPHSLTAANEISILIAGESTAGGEPFYNTPPRTIISYYLSRFAPALSPRIEEVVRFGGSLRRTYPEIVRAIDRFEPQVVITMFGNNDYLGEYSSETYCDEKQVGIFVRLSRYSALVRLALERLMPEEIGSAPIKASRTLFDRPVVCRAESQRVENTHSLLLDKLSKMTLEKGGTFIPVFLASNEVDFEPNRSVFLESEAQKLAFSDLYAKGTSFLEKGDINEALKSFDLAQRVGPTFAYINFVVGRMYLALGNSDAARRFLAAATEFDGFPYRVKPSFRKRLIEEASQRSDRYLDLNDAFRQYAPFQILNNRLVGDVHHPTLEGYNILAFEVAKRINALLPDLFVSIPHLISLPEVIEALNIDQSVWYDVALHNLTWTGAYKTMSFEPSHRNEVMRRNLQVLDLIDKPYTDHIISPEKRREIEEISAKYPKAWKLPPLEELWSGFDAKISSRYSFQGFKPLAFHSFIPVTQNKQLDGSAIKSEGRDVEGFILHPWADRPGAVLIDLSNATQIEGNVSVAVTGSSVSTIRCSLNIDGKRVFNTDVLNIKSLPVKFKESLNNNKKALLMCDDAGDGNAFDHALISELSVR